MLTAEQVRQQIETIISDLISSSLSVDQTFPSLRKSRTEVKVDFGKSDISVALRNQPYKEIYDELVQAKSFSFKLIDGAVVQLMYQFNDDSLVKHRLAFFPSPYLEEYQNNPEVYESDEIYADIVRRDIVPFPVRFDFDLDESVVVDVDHPKSHLTLGQYLNCRIPVSAPVSPYYFIRFILQNFYNTAFCKFQDQLNSFDASFERTITENEQRMVFIEVP